MGKRLHKELEAAFSSAKTKYPSIDDLLRGREGREERKSIIENHMRQLSLEMERDASSNNFLKAVAGFLRKKFARIQRDIT